MGLIHRNADVGAECDQFRETISTSETKITSDTHDENNNRTTVEYINGEGDPPFIKYRLTLEAIAALSPEQYEKEEDVSTAEKEEDAA